ncbi:hypothetical protein OIU84_016283 [Salix udensis]|uniref:Uncharacterized protein n=1 Tax=Salix udensis TaxID=889485 RepID=A0AAD6NQK5_9ROSI|nr:hypothetical protein OIU84_016283 [Salix udensis]
MAPGDDILLMGASSMDSTTATRHEHIESMQSGGEVIPETRQPQPPFQAEMHISSSGIAESDRKIALVTNPKPRLNDSARKGRFIHHETTISSHRSCPPSVYLLNAVLGVVLFLIMLREALIVH